MKLDKVKYFTTISRLKNNPFHYPAHQGDLQSAYKLINYLNLNLSFLKISPVMFARFPILVRLAIPVQYILVDF